MTHSSAPTIPYPSVPNYTYVDYIASGTYSDVYHFKADTDGGKSVAIKILTNDCLHEPDATFMKRELSVMKMARDNPNLLTLIHCFRAGYQQLMHIVMEFCPYSLHDRILFTPKIPYHEIKFITACLLEGLSFLHDRNVMHRDLKPDNILITTMGQIKIADFGFAREFEIYITPGRQRHYSADVVTLWFRAPELLLGATDYGPEVDMWSLGCIIPNLCTNSMLFPGESEKDQLMYITEICGSIRPSITLYGEIMHSRYEYMKLPEGLPRNLKAYLRNAKLHDELMLDLVDKLLDLNPNQRILTSQALTHNAISDAYSFC